MLALNQLCAPLPGEIGAVLGGIGPNLHHVDAVDSTGNSALYYAALCDRERLVRALLGKGASPGGKDGSVWKNALTPQIRAVLEAANAGQIGAAKTVTAPPQVELEEDYGYGLIGVLDRPSLQTLLLSSLVFLRF